MFYIIGNDNNQSVKIRRHWLPPPPSLPNLVGFCEVLTTMFQSGPAKKLTWASVASTPAKPTPQLKKKAGGLLPPPMLQTKHNMDIGTWEAKNGGASLKPVAPPSAQPRVPWATQAVTMRGRAPPPLGPPQQQQQYPPVGPGIAVAPPVLHHQMHPPQGDFCEFSCDLI